MKKLILPIIMILTQSAFSDSTLPTRLDLAEYELTQAKSDWSWEKLKKLTPSDLEKMDQETMDRLFSVLTSGPIPSLPNSPTVEFTGKILIAKEGPVDNLKKLHSSSKQAQRSAELLESFGEYFWKGKRFNSSTMVLQNRIDLTFYTAWRFPAKLYCGASLLDSRRHSIIIDYAYNDQLETPIDPSTGYSYFGGGPADNFATRAVREKLDGMVNRNGMMIRDEIRMIRPGFYVGRAYMKGVFVLNFSLYNAELAKNPDVAFDDACWSGEQNLAVIGANRKHPFTPTTTVDAFYAQQN